MVTASLLVTGGAGFIGSWFVRTWFRERGGAVVNLDKLTYAGHLANLQEAAEDPRHTFIEGDVGDRNLVSGLMAKYRPQAVVHLAAESHVDRSIDGPAAFVQTNVLGTFELLDAVLDYWRGLDPAAREAFRFLHASTDEVYGPAAGQDAFAEGDRYRPSSMYAASKAAADHFVQAYHRTYGLPTLLTHCTNNYGPYQYPEKLIPLMIRMTAAGEPLPVYGDGLHERDWLFVEDHCRALVAVLERGTPGGVYHVAAGEPRTNLDVVRAVCRFVDATGPVRTDRPCESLITHVPDRPAHDRRYALDSRKVTRDLGWSPQVRFEEGLERTVRWYLENPEWVAEVTQGRYAFERLGLR